MPDITAADVRALKRKYSGEPPDPPACSVCAKPMYVNQVSSEGFEFGCRCGHAIRSDDPYLFDPQVVSLCRLALAVLEPGEGVSVSTGLACREAAMKEKYYTHNDAYKAWLDFNAEAMLFELIKKNAELARLRAENAELRGQNVDH